MGEGGGLKVACSSFLFTGLPLSEAFRKIASLGFKRAELSIHYKSAWGHFLPDMVHSEPEKALRMAEAAASESGVGISAVAAHFDPLAQAERGQFEAVCELASNLGAAIVSVVANQPSEWLAANAMKDHVSIARARGITLAVEIFRPSSCPDMQSGLRLVEQIKGLKLTLDSGHLMADGKLQEEWGPIFPHVGHVHLKDSGTTPDEFQVPVGEGSLNISSLLNDLVRVGYSGELVVEYIGPTGGRKRTMDYETESLRLREILESELLDSGTAS